MFILLNGNYEIKQVILQSNMKAMSYNELVFHHTCEHLLVIYWSTEANIKTMGHEGSNTTWIKMYTIQSYSSVSKTNREITSLAMQWLWCQAEIYF